jgi:hypothetical protein
VRWEYELGQSEGKNRFNVGFDPIATATYTNPSSATVSVKGGIEFAGVGGAPVHCCANSHVKFSPRVGVAYAILPKTVVHAGFGFFYAPLGIVAANAGYSPTHLPATAQACCFSPPATPSAR